MATREFLDEHKLNIALVLGLVVFAILSRFLPHPPNFSPVAAVALFAGATLPKRTWVFVVPLVIMVVSDAFLGFHSLIAYTWGSFAVIGLLSYFLFKKIDVTRVIGASLLASILFFIVTNFGVWAEGRLYPQTFEGLMSSYYNAIPFFRNTLMGDMFYSGVLFGAYAYVTKFAGRRIAVRSEAS